MIFSSSTRAYKRIILSAFPVFVPSLSWQNDHFKYQTAQKDAFYYLGLLPVQLVVLLLCLLALQSEKTAFWGHLYIKCIILPRQARDKHRENSKTMPFSQENENGSESGL
jgi:hypothetical protein